MRKRLFLGIFLCMVLSGAAQIVIIGHNMINHSPLSETTIHITAGGKTIQHLNTRSKTEFRVQLDFGRNYKIYFRNERCPTMFMEVNGDNVPQERFEYRMTYELNVPFVDKLDADVDTTVFSRAFHRVIYNGRSKMVDDTAYNNAFARTVMKGPEEKPQTLLQTEVETLPSIVAGRVSVAGKPKLRIANTLISILGRDGRVIRTTHTNRYGLFVFPQIKITEAAMLRMEMTDPDPGIDYLILSTTAGEKVSDHKVAEGICEWPVSTEALFSMVDNQYSHKIGGKLICSSPKHKKFFANKTVYLANKLNTVVQKTQTSKLGTFVFEGIKPDQQYLLGIARSDFDQGEKIDLLNKEDQFVGTLDSATGNRTSLSLFATYNKRFNAVEVDEDDLKMDVKGTIFGDNVNNPIGNLKIILLNDEYEVIDSTVTSDLGAFKFRYLPFLKRFYLSAENNDNMLDVFRNILIYSSEDNLIKVMTHQKGGKFRYNPVPTEVTHLRNIEMNDPWLEFLEPELPVAHGASANEEKNSEKAISENILFETARYDISDESRDILDKIILVLNTNLTLRLEIGAHTDSKGSIAANNRLSDLRAKTVRAYIISSGIPQHRIESRGYGETRLLNNCSDGVPCSELEHAQNRRIEFKILGEKKNEND